MGGAFNPQILVEKLAKLNSSQTSIETLSHWCIFHMNKAKPVVETWDRQFHCAPREQRLAYLYLANDILQNSRRKGAEFVGEFWKVLPEALRDVMENGDEFGRNAAQRLVNIWDERKVFGSRGQVLKDEIVGRHLETNNRDGKQSGYKLRPSAGNALDKIVSDYQLLYGGQLDEDAMLLKCRNAVSSVDKVEKEIGGDINAAKLTVPGVVGELQGQHGIFRGCIEQLNAVESSRANLVFHLKEALQEEEFKLDQVRQQLQAAQSADNLCRQFLSNPQMVAEQSLKENPVSVAPHSFLTGTREQSAPVMYTRQAPFADKPGEDTKATAAAVAAKLTASTSSAQMLTYVLNSLASGAMGNSPIKEDSGDLPAEKRPKLEPPPPQLQVPPYPTTPQEMPADEHPPPPSSPPPLPPLPPPMQQYPVPQYMQTAGTMNASYSYLSNQQPPPPPIPGYTPIRPANNHNGPYMGPPQPGNYQSFQGAEGGFYSQQSSLPMAPMSRQ